MRIACCISTLILVAACGSQPAQQPPPATASSSTTATPVPPPTAQARTARVQFPSTHGPVAIDVAIDDTVAADAAPHRVEVIAELPDRAVVLVDRYPSMPGGLSMCQAGEESFVRVVSLQQQPRTTFTAKIGSCVQNIELADPGLEWRADQSTLRIEWLSNAAGMPETREVTIASDGTVASSR